MDIDWTKLITDQVQILNREQDKHLKGTSDTASVLDAIEGLCRLFEVRSRIEPEQTGSEAYPVKLIKQLNRRVKQLEDEFIVDCFEEDGDG